MLKLEFIKNNTSRFETFKTVEEAIDRIDGLAVKNKIDIFSLDSAEKLNGMSGDNAMAKQLAELLRTELQADLILGKKLDKSHFTKLKAKELLVRILPAKEDVV